MKNLESVGKLYDMVIEQFATTEGQENGFHTRVCKMLLSSSICGFTENNIKETKMWLSDVAQMLIWLNLSDHECVN